MENLMIIESPNKVKTISRFLPDNFEIISTVGHIRDLSMHGFGFDKQTLDPIWAIIKDKKTTDKKVKGLQTKEKIVEEILKKAKGAKNIYLATDPDREGEAIAWHVYDILDNKNQEKCHRITFNEITKNAVLNAIANPRKIDLNYVNAQFARRILDRMIGYKLSSLVHNTLHGDSAGRVQSLALDFLLKREDEIKNFVPVSWWIIDALLQNQWQLNLNKVNNELVPATNYYLDSNIVHFKDEQSAIKIKDSLNKDFIFDHLDPAKPYSANAPEPFRTSTMQQEAINQLGWTAKKITHVAQVLYEGIDIKGEHMALISYPRTDSMRYSKEFVEVAKKYITDKYGTTFVSSKDYSESSNKNKINVQDGHEAIRVIDVNIQPDDLKDAIPTDEYKLYKLIWLRSVASLMANAKFERTTIWFNNNKNLFFLNHHVCKFAGWRIVYGEKDDADNIDLSQLSSNKVFTSQSIGVSEHKSEPPARYTQATLIADLEKSGVGRPSTYSTMANIPIDRGYATLEKRHYYITDLGEKVSQKLNHYFPEIINIAFTRDMEERLDKITNGKEEWKTWLLDFWPQLIEKAKIVNGQLKEEKANEVVEYVGEMCPLDNGKLIYRYSHKGHSKFIGCENFPKCKYIKSLKEPPTLIGEKCPKCNGDLVERENKKHQKFVGCLNFPKCKFIRTIPKEKSDSLDDTKK